MRAADHPIPPRMAHLKRDARGYPVFFIAMIDDAGAPQFTMNDVRKMEICQQRDLCGICGTKLFRGRWFIGGPLSALLDNGVYFDPPMHDECAHYALNVCPWLALGNYRRIENGKLQKDTFAKLARGAIEIDRERTSLVILKDETVIPGRPGVFVAVMAVGQRLVPGDELTSYYRPKRPYRKVEFWRHGRQLGGAEGRAAVLAFLDASKGKEGYRDHDVSKVAAELDRCQAA